MTDAPFDRKAFEAERPRLDAEVFKKAAQAIDEMKSGNVDVDMSPVEAASKYLDGFGRHLEEFAKVNAATRSLLWGAAQKVSRKSRTEPELFSVVREMVGSTRDIRKANGKLDRTHLFLTELGSIGS